MIVRYVLIVMLAVAPSCFASDAVAQGSLNVLCSVQQEWCTAVAATFQKETGIKVAITQKGSGEGMAQVAAERANPKLDIWFGGTGDPHLQAAEQDLTQAYKSPRLAELHPWAQKQAETSGFKTVGIYAGALGFGYNTELLAKKKLAAPACWKDLLRPELKDDIQMANPNASGTAYTAIATLVQVMGEDTAFAYLKDLHKNISAYPKSARARSRPSRAARRRSASASSTMVPAKRWPASP
jgi:iron(III) transport system substrate-binding protein